MLELEQVNSKGKVNEMLNFLLIFDVHICDLVTIFSGLKVR